MDNPCTKIPARNGGVALVWCLLEAQARQLGPLLLRSVWDRGEAPSLCTVMTLIHFIPDSRTYSVPLFLKRQCDRTLGWLLLWRSLRAPGRAHARRPRDLRRRGARQIEPVYL